MAIEDAKKLFLEKDAKLSDLTTQPVIGNRRLSRFWDNIRDKDMQPTLDAMDKYTSAKNKTASFTVNKPEASHCDCHE